MILRRLFRRSPAKPPQDVLVNQIALNLIDASNLLEKVGVKCWLTDGTLLGCYREGRILPHDKDADLGAFISEFSQDILDAFDQAGWELAHVYGEIDCGLQLSYRKESAKVDLFFFYQEGDRYWHGAWKSEQRGKFRNLIKYYYQPFEFREMDFLGFRFTVPADTEKYLATKYGEGWNVVQKEWDWAYGPANAVATDIRFPKNKKNVVR